MQWKGQLLMLPLLLGVLPGQHIGLTEAKQRRVRPRTRDRTELASPSQPDEAYCPPCDINLCPPVTTQTCDGNIVKDWCNCCSMCVSRSNRGGNKHTSHDQITAPSAAIETDSTVTNTQFAPSNANQSEACAKINCGKFQVCMLNIQGLPMCRCPTKFWCAKGDRSPVCGQDDITYKSKCYLKMAECETGKNIPMKYRNKCYRSDKDRMIKEEKMRQKELKQQQKQENRKKKQEKKMRKKVKKERKERKRHRQEKRQQKKRRAQYYDFKF